MASAARDDESNIEVLSCTSVIGEAPLDPIKQGVCFKRLSEKALRADRDRFIVQMFVRQSRDEDYGCHDAAFVDLSYEVKSTHPRHMNISDDTVEAEQVGRRQERFRRDIRLGPTADGAHQIHEGQAQRSVVVDDRDERACHRM
jgi:hypothetical protein